MRYRKKELFHTIDLLEKANETIEKFSIKGKIQEISQRQQMRELTDMLTDCQTAAIEMGTCLETLGDVSVPIVKVLEEYCEDIYMQSINLDKSDLCRKIAKKIRKELCSVRNAIKFELISEKKEIVFLPYKASMWDSLESIWMAAKDGEDCEAYVIPIPYFDKNPDGSFRQMHYEGNEYPKYVPITDWQEYDFEERKPDIIYIHNPYDNYNAVTSVHPAFYSDELNKYTDCLTYIPYFVLPEISTENKRSVDYVKNFVLLPGVLNADKVIVQSEKIKDVYIKILTEHTEIKDKEYWEERILGLGSPKFDKSANIVKEEIDMPEEWRRILKRADGTWKKIIFYNTTLSAFLKKSDKYFEKVRYVLKIFEENSDDVALLWRPHPLFGSTIAAMRPQLAEEYDMIVRQYKRGGWGIYDDTADFDRAVKLSDAYYGDRSSVVYIFQKIKKPVTIQNIEILEEKI